MIITYLAKSFNQASVYQNLLHEKFACFSFYYKLRLKYLNILFFCLEMSYRFVNDCSKSD